MASSLLLSAIVAAPTAVASEWEFSGDLRGLYASSWRDARDGSTRDSDSFGSRLRMRLARDLSSQWRFQSRLAGTWRDEGNDHDWFIRPERQTSTSVTPGTVTFDEFFLQYRTIGGGGEFRFGRFQSSLVLPMLTSKNLDRNQASNINVGWTDGVQWKQKLGGGWESLLVAQYNSRNGNGALTRSPLDFSDSGSRISTFAALLNEEEQGPIIHRSISVNWYPEALATDGQNNSRRQDYTTLTGRIAAAWPLSDGTRFVLGGELGAALNTPDATALSLPGSGDADRLAWLVSADLRDVWPGHSFGVVVGHADAGWLISNDVRNNDRLAEARWKWQLSSAVALEWRARWRRELEQRAGVFQKQRDRDMYWRVTWKF